jgi:hypothetical protein
MRSNLKSNGTFTERSPQHKTTTQAGRAGGTEHKTTEKTRAIDNQLLMTKTNLMINHIITNGYIS